MVFCLFVCLFFLFQVLSTIFFFCFPPAILWWKPQGHGYQAHPIWSRTKQLRDIPVRLQADWVSAILWWHSCHWKSAVSNFMMWIKKWKFSPLNTQVCEVFLSLENLLNQGTCLAKMRGMSAERSVEMTASVQYFLHFGLVAWIDVFGIVYSIFWLLK